MKIDQDNLWLCRDCLMLRCNGEMDPTLSVGEEKAILDGMERLGPNLVPNFDIETGTGVTEFSRRPCDCCGTPLAGDRYRFATLTND